MHLKSFAKINLSLDVGKPMESGMHPVDTVMQLLSLHDDIEISIVGGSSGDVPKISLTCSNSSLPTDSRNLAYRAATLILKEAAAAGKLREGASVEEIEIHIDIHKSIPLEAGLAGGSGNAAAVLIGLNLILDLGFTTEDLYKIGAKLGADVPFCIMGQWKYLDSYGDGSTRPKLGTVPLCKLICKVEPSPIISYAARGRGTGTELTPVAPLKAYVLLAKPREGVSTKSAYEGFDKCCVTSRPDNDKLEQALLENDIPKIAEQMINVLENYTLTARPDVAELKDTIQDAASIGGQEMPAENPIKVLMSGSGPTVFALFTEKAAAESVAQILQTKYQKNTKSPEGDKVSTGSVELFLCETLV